MLDSQRIWRYGTDRKLYKYTAKKIAQYQMHDSSSNLK